jgi:cellulose synthase/poly-beta-1,6-N-acetylglucosamine synthase-like glycosyltransferase
MLLTLIAYFLFALYTMASAYITFFCLMQLNLLFQYLKRNQRKTRLPEDTNGMYFLPTITIQLPVFNERYVIERLINNIVLMDYPAEKLQIQLLDDSTDDTRDIALQMVNDYQGKGIPIEYVHRTKREGYKAGALRDGLQTATGEFIAIFDADFLPRPDFLRLTIPYFLNEKIGVVQTRWEHINDNYSLLTRLQAFLLNTHFTIEQSGRQSGKYFLQFNGTAGIWRRKTIEDAGGWEADTLTEDLDLSYRAQLKGWEIVYCQEITSPSELPVDMHGLKSQQFRWMKGGAENARKLIPAVYKSGISATKKLHAVIHLLSSSVYLAIFILGILSVPTLFLLESIHFNMNYFWMFVVGLPTLAWISFVANRDTMWTGKSSFYQFITFLVSFPVFLSFSMGLSLHNSIAVLQGYAAIKGVFVRTPKYNILQRRDSFKKHYGSARISLSTILEGVLALYFLTAIVYGIMEGKMVFLVYHLMLMAGFTGVFFYSILHLRRK